MPTTAIPLTHEQKLTAYRIRIAREEAAKAERHGYIESAAWWSKRAAEIEAAEKAKGAK